MTNVVGATKNTVAVIDLAPAYLATTAASNNAAAASKKSALVYLASLAPSSRRTMGVALDRMAATANRHLAALPRVLKAAWCLGQIGGGDYRRPPDQEPSSPSV